MVHCARYYPSIASGFVLLDRGASLEEWQWFLEIFSVNIFSIRIVNYIKILPPMNLSTAIPLVMIAIEIVGTSFHHLLGYHWL